MWGKILYWVRESDFIPLKEEFSSERGELVRAMTFSEVRPMGGHTIDPEIFTQRNLQKP